MNKLVSAALVLLLTNAGLQSGHGDIYRKQLSDEQNLPASKPEQKTAKQKLESAVLTAINQNDLTTAQAILETSTILEDDKQAVVMEREALSERYRNLQDLIIKNSTMRKRRLQLSADKATQEPAQVAFFNHMLGNVAYDVHADKPAVIAANKNLALLKAAGNYIDKLGQTYKGYINDAGQCPICLDDFTQNLAPHPHIAVLTAGLETQESPEVQNNSSKREIIACKNNHGICVPCFYNPDNPSTCSLCREPLRYNQYNTCLQCGAGKDLAFTYCKSCGAVSIACSACKTLSCCGALKKAVAPEEHAQIKTQAEALIKRCQKECQEYKAAQKAEMKRILDEDKKRHLAELEKIKEVLDDIEKKRADIKALMESESGDREVLMYQDQQLDHQESVYCLDGQAKMDKAEKFKSDTEAHYEDKIKLFSDQKKREEESIKKMVKDATGFDLVVAAPASVSPLIALLSALFN